MKKDNILGIVIMACGLLLVLCVFLPYVTYYSSSVSLWKMEDSSTLIYILLGLFVIALYLINKKTEMAYLAAGYGIFTSIANIIALEGFGGLSIAFYLIFLSSVSIAVLTFLYDESEADALINLSVSVNKSVINNNTTENTQPVVPQQMQTVNNSETLQSVNSTGQTNTGHTMKFDPNTGEPINQNNN